MTILDKIIAHKRTEVAAAKEVITVEELLQSPHFSRETISLKDRLLAPDGPHIIAEFKRKSPSKGEIHPRAMVESITGGYSENGAAGISVLTDQHFFGGSKEDLLEARKHNPDTPLLRKDFMVDAYQMYEARAWGADVILLIAANLSPEEINTLGKKARELDLEVLLEIHDREELKKSPLEYVDIIGVNNRNLKNFAENNVNASLDLFGYLPDGLAKISESCISHPDTVKELMKVGYQGFLMGENFMKTSEPAQTLKEFIAAVNEKN